MFRVAAVLEARRRCSARRGAAHERAGGGARERPAWETVDRPRGPLRAAAPRPSCSAGAATRSATSRTPTSARSASGCPARCPVLNAAGRRVAMRIGTALHCEIRPSLFHRKNYFYPDMPKDYQISQYDEPINVGGYARAARRHPGRHRRGPTSRRTPARPRTSAAADASTTPTTRSSTTTGPACRWSRSSASPTSARPTQARAYAAELRAILVATGASDGRMEEGSHARRRQRVGAPVGRRRVRDALRDQEPELAALARPGHRVRGRRGRWPCSRRARRSSRRRGTGTRTPARPSVDALQGRGVRLPLLPRARPRAARCPTADWAPGGRRDRGAAGGSAGPALVDLLGGDADRRPDATRSSPWSIRGSTSW